MKCELEGCPCNKSVQPITDVVDPRGKDWPGRNPPRSKRPDVVQTRSIMSLLDDETRRKLIRKYPRIRRLIPKEKHSEDHKHQNQ